jgi:hypothetical protein
MRAHGRIEVRREVCGGSGPLREVFEEWVGRGGLVPGRWAKSPPETTKETLQRLSPHWHFPDGKISYLHLAAFAGYGAAVQVLMVEPKIDVNRLSAAGRAPLHIACERADVRSVRALIKAGADIELRCAGGETPILAAALGRNERVIEVLLQNRAKPTVRDDNGKSVIERFLAPEENGAMIAYSHRRRELRCIMLIAEAGLFPTDEEQEAIRAIRGINIEQRRILNATLAKILVLSRVNRSGSQSRSTILVPMETP